MKFFLQVTAIMAGALWTQVATRITFKTSFGLLFVESTVIFLVIWTILIIFGAPVAIVNAIIKRIRKTNLNHW